MPANRIYLDHAATTPMRPEAIAAVNEAMGRWANPSSPHADGRAAKDALEDARSRIKASLGWKGELIFTSGASEALAIGLGRANADRQSVSAVEHDAVFRAAPDAEILPVVEGRVDPEKLAEQLGHTGRAVVAIQSVNSETGAKGLWTPDDALIDQVRNAGGLFLSDCSQSAGKDVLPDADMIVVSAHKLGGPPGIGALLVRDFGMLQPSGGQEFGYRAGTENLPAVLGFAAALQASANAENWQKEPAVIDAMLAFKDEVWRTGGQPIYGDAAICIRIMAIAAPSMSAAAQLIRFDSEGFAVSAGSACSSGSLKPSRVLKAYGVPDDVASRTIRVSIGWNTTVAEVEAFQAAWLDIAGRT